MVTEVKRCPECGAELPPDSPAGHCPECLLKLGVEGDPSQEDVAATVNSPAPGSSPGGFEPPSLAELGGRFPQLEIIELLGQGGMGAVYKSRQPKLDRYVALKILPPLLGNDPAFAERFAREAQALAKLNHPNIVTVYDFGDVDGLFYFVMEFVDGVNLRQSIQSKKLSAEEALAIVPQICDALQFAHEEGVVHRDIKPENVLLDRKRRVKIADFGLAKLLNRSTDTRQLTISHQVMGTMHYMAPEQMEKPLEVDHRADIYSLGVVFYELLTGTLPIGRFPLPSEESQADARLDEVVLKAIEREPDRRYQQASHVKTDIESLSSVRQASNLPEPEGLNAAQDEADAKPTPRVDDAELEDLRRQVKGPATGLVVAGVLNLLPAVFVLVGFVLALIVLQVPGPAELAIIALTLGLNLPAGIVMLIGGIKMRRLESYGLAMTSSILAVIPGVSCIIGLPFGIWSLIALNRSEVKAAFDGRRRNLSQPQVEEKPLSEADRLRVQRMIKGPAIGLLIVALVSLLPIVLVVVAFVYRSVFVSYGG